MIKKLLKIVLVGLIAGIGFLVYVNREVERVGEEFVYTDLEDLPRRDVAVVLGTSRFISTGRENSYFIYRIDAAEELYRSGKVDLILVSGDNADVSYNEPLAMQRALIDRGVPAENIRLDYAGFRTLDSVVRAQEVFQQSEFIVVSQPFHVKRAIYIARTYDIPAIGYAAEDVSISQSLRIQVREVLARGQAWIDVNILNQQPKFLGEKIDLNDPEKLLEQDSELQ